MRFTARTGGSKRTRRRQTGVFEANTQRPMPKMPIASRTIRRFRGLVPRQSRRDAPPGAGERGGGDAPDPLRRTGDHHDLAVPARLLRHCRLSSPPAIRAPLTVALPPPGYLAFET